MKQKQTRTNKKAVVFGGSGFLGSHVADALSERGFPVTIFDKKPSSYLKAGQQMLVGDISDMDAVAKAVKGCGVIYHFAGFADLDEAVSNPLGTIRENILGTAIVLEAAAAAKVERFVYASTIYVYSRLGGFYRCSKQAAELYVEEFQNRRHLDFTILRFGTLYGPRADQHNSMWRYMHEALTTRKISFFGTGDENREYIHVRDAAKLSVDILGMEFCNQHVVITGHHPMKAREMLQMIKEILNNGVTIKFIPKINKAAHYNLTPYSFTPKVGNKLVSNSYVDMGQGLLECMNEIHKAKEAERK